MKTIELFAFLIISTFLMMFSKAAQATDDLLDFWDCDLTYQQYVAAHYESWNGSTWVDVLNAYQPFKTKTNWAWGQCYWLKNDFHNWCGELFKYDASNLYRYTETYGPKESVDPPWQPDWDDRVDRFRLFLLADQSDWGHGECIAPRNGSTSWTYTGYVDTYLCNSFDQCNNKTAPLFQNNVYDSSITIQRYGPFSTVFDGTCSGWPASAPYNNFDEVIVINQEESNYRERLFLARKGTVHYGIVRWDSAFKTNGVWTVNERTIGLNTQTYALGLSFGGFFTRARENIYLTKHPKVNTGDFTGDYFDDFTIINNTGGIYAGLGTSDLSTGSVISIPNPWAPGFASQQTWCKPLGTGDINGDGYADYIMVNGTGGIYAGIYNDQYGTTGAMAITNQWPTAFNSGQSWILPLGVGDINKDGIADYVVIAGDGYICAVLQNGSGGIASLVTITNPWSTFFRTTSPSPQYAKALGIGDFDGDGYADFAFIINTGAIYIGYGNGSGGTTGLIVTNPLANFNSTNMTYKPIMVADIDGNEYADIVVVDTAGVIKCLLCNGKRAANCFYTVATKINPWASGFQSDLTFCEPINVPFGWGYWF